MTTYKCDVFWKPRTLYISLIIRQVSRSRQSDNRNYDIYLPTNETVDKYIGRMQQYPKLQN